MSEPIAWIDFGTGVTLLAPVTAITELHEPDAEFPNGSVSCDCSVGEVQAGLGDVIFPGDPRAPATRTEPVTVYALGEVIWDTSRRDEGSISFAGAQIVARAILDAFDVSTTSQEAPRG